MDFDHNQSLKSMLGPNDIENRVDSGSEASSDGTFKSKRKVRSDQVVVAESNPRRSTGESIAVVVTQPRNSKENRTG